MSSNGRLGYKHSPETIEKLRKANIGKRMSLAARAKMSASKLGKERKPHTKETKLKMSLASKGRSKSTAHRKALKEASLRKYRNGFASPLTKIWKENPKFLVAENNPNWKGGISKIDKSIRQMKEYLKWRSAVFQRDAYSCQQCGISKTYVTAHHIKSFAVIVNENAISTRAEARKCKELWNVSNGQTLCEPCHAKTDNYRGRVRINR